MRDQFDISGVFETTEFEIAQGYGIILTVGVQFVVAKYQRAVATVSAQGIQNLDKSHQQNVVG